MSQAKPTKAETDRYASHYVLTGKQSEAFRVAFPKSKAAAETVHVKASYFHALGSVQVRIKELSEKARSIAEEEFQLNAEYVARRLKEIDELDILDIMEDDLKAFKPLSGWPKSWRRSVSGIDLMTLSSSENIESIVKKVKWPDKTRNLELIGKHVDVRAWDSDLHEKQDKAPALNITFDVAPAKDEVKVTRGGD